MRRLYIEHRTRGLSNGYSGAGNQDLILIYGIYPSQGQPRVQTKSLSLIGFSWGKEFSQHYFTTRLGENYMIEYRSSDVQMLPRPPRRVTLWILCGFDHLLDMLAVSAQLIRVPFNGDLGPETGSCGTSGTSASPGSEVSSERTQNAKPQPMQRRRQASPVHSSSLPRPRASICP